VVEACSTDGTGQRYMQGLVPDSEGTRPLGRSRHRRAYDRPFVFAVSNFVCDLWNLCSPKPHILETVTEGRKLPVLEVTVTIERSSCEPRVEGKEDRESESFVLSSFFDFSSL